LPEATRRALRDNLKRWADESRRQRQARDELAGRFGVAMASLPWLEEAPISLQGLTRLLDAAEGLPLDRLGLIGTE
jgi:hypothetical protein